MKEYYNNFELFQNLCAASSTYQAALTELSFKTKPDSMAVEVQQYLLHKLGQVLQRFWSNRNNLEYYLNESKKLAYNSSPALASSTNGKFELHSCLVNLSHKNQTALLLNTIRRVPKNLSGMNYSSSGELNKADLQLLEFFTKQMSESLAPANFLFTNQETWAAILSTNGRNLYNGAKNFLQDVRRTSNDVFRISTVDESAFAVGKNLAITQGKVIYRDELVELIQYEATTEKVRAEPILVVSAWINKYYILDLQPHNSFIKHAVDQGSTVFAVSWKNPTAALAHKDLNDYLSSLIKVVEKVYIVSDQQQIHCVGYCLGGTLVAIMAAYFNSLSIGFLKSITFLASLTSFEECGDISIFLDEGVRSIVKRHLEITGYFDGDIMYNTFSLLKSKNMVWSYFTKNYLQGHKPDAFDILYWNSDSTRLPREMYLSYVKNMYVENSLAKPCGFSVTVGGRSVLIDLQEITIPIYGLAAREDHISPWQTVYCGLKLCKKASKRFVLTTAGHVAGIVNPPAKHKYEYCHSNEIDKKTLSDFLSTSNSSPGSWWPDWHGWIQNLSGDAALQSRQIKSWLCEAPGTYVFEK